MRIPIHSNRAPGSGLAVWLAGAVLAVTALVTAPAHAIEVTGSFTGWWGQPDQQNHGVIIAVSRLPSGEKTGVLYWAHFDDMGNPSWLIAQGDIEADTIMAEVFRFDGITFMQTEDENANFGEAIGTMEVQFESCLEGNVEFTTDDPVVGAGEFRIERLTNQPGAVCSGGIGDDFSLDGLPEGFEIMLAPTGVIPGASGKAEFKASPGRAEFEVEINDVPAGEYELQVGGITRGLITVADTSTGDGEIEFRSPVADADALLDFDPRDQIIDVLLDGEVVLTALTPEHGDFPGNGPPPFDVPASSSVDIELDLTNEGVYPDGSASAEFHMAGNRVEFEIGVENIPVGAYPVFIGGIKRGDVVVTEDDDETGETEGELEFRFPSGGPDRFDFDPRGESIEILEGSTLLFSGDFPEGESEGRRRGPPEDRGPGNGNGPPGDRGNRGGNGNGDDDEDDDDDDDDDEDEDDG
ncbi:MAG: hypothetical protein RQ847_02875 [Wenzhouxiangellaceae bacterium]|nr:hypothetical protein [Wenzhouxiangellaceae bacterium]